MKVIDEFTVGRQQVQLVMPELEQASDFYTLIEADREELAQFMTWASETRTVTDERRFLAYAIEKNQKRELFLLTILVNGKVAGSIDLHNFNWRSKQAEFGYWLGRAFQGMGIMTQAVLALQTYARKKLKLCQFFLLADPENEASIAVADRTGFRPAVKRLYQIRIIIIKSNLNWC
ncbi:GNAT family N-acetyltransferase [Fructobacillus ficulneus]|uniref:Acetyltransferase n=1 Tax=Fructobacillus ficulneus TaxID=157463 RepID=A0A0K8MJM2_9LACO|nr:GNAT family N-acetyltransferase [Fructobacillus ficulneus]GAP00065.1 acetyltransferase [Fructobacillus ficulneus]